MLTPDADPRAVYHDVLIALDETRQINNGQPSLWAFLLDQLDVAAGERVLHLGCGTGYYTAVVAELAGPTGKITAVEIDADLAEKARIALEPWPQITVSNADGSNLSCEPADLIIASAGAGKFVVAGLRGDEQFEHSNHGHVVVVATGPLAHGRYPSAYWGRLGGDGAKFETVNWAWTEHDRDRVTYAEHRIA